MPRVIWTLGARQHVEHIRKYISQLSPLAARRFALLLVTTGESLSAYPMRGRPVSSGIRDLAIVAPYLIQYRLQNGVVEILTIRHGAREA
ncbi:type II toxin-antitoxin system RelE/ParE family toxin [Brevundimonas sp.]|uniref:type II toxin-antitoxin system RelE/ParE family toxin n=1 Tax=Brevundimonas sp. TaxID=1871086 RepID=UPI0038D3DFD2